MRASYRIPNAARGAYAREYRLMCVWAVRATSTDVNDILRACGLTGAGSPPNVMNSIYVMANARPRTSPATLRTCRRSRTPRSRRYSSSWTA
jgi:hypothetical protein